MQEPGYAPNPRIPNVALYLALRGRHGQKRCPRNVGEARGFATRNPDLAIAAEKLIQEVYGAPSPFLTNLENRYQLLSKELKQTVLWQEAAELFVAGEGKRVLRLF